LPTGSQERPINFSVKIHNTLPLPPLRILSNATVEKTARCH
jgi:hypothetical protein